MHKSWGNAIEFDEAAERMGVDVMRWMFVKARPEDNILFGWHAADEARRELLVLWNVYAFFVTYARLAGWSPTAAAPPVDQRPVLDRWILSRAAGTAATVEARLLDVDAVGATRALSRLSRRPVDLVPAPVAAPLLAPGRSDRPGCGVRDPPRGARGARPDAGPDPAVPGRGDVRQPRRGRRARGARQRPPDPLADGRAGGPPRRGARGRDGARAGRGRPRPDAARLGPPQDASAAATAWLALPDRGVVIGERPAPAHRDEINVKEVEVIDDESELVERRVKPLLPRIGARLGSAIPPIMAAARAGEFTIEPDGSVTLAGVALAPDEVEIQATPRPGTAVAHDDGLVVVLDTSLTPGAGRRGRCPRAGARRPGPAPRGGPRARRPDRAVGRPAAGGRRAAPPTVAADTLAETGHRRAAAGCAAGVGRARRRPGRHRAASTAWRPVSRVATRDADAMTEAGATDAPATLPADDVAGSSTTSPRRRPARVRSGAHWLVFLGLASGSWSSTS